VIFPQILSAEVIPKWDLLTAKEWWRDEWQVGRAVDSDSKRYV